MTALRFSVTMPRSLTLAVLSLSIGGAPETTTGSLSPEKLQFLFTNIFKSASQFFQFIKEKNLHEFLVTNNKLSYNKNHKNKVSKKRPCYNHSETGVEKETMK